MKNVPNEIWLHVGEETPADADFKELGEVTWSDNQQEESAIRYIREDVVGESCRNEYKSKVARRILDLKGVSNQMWQWFQNSSELSVELCKISGDKGDWDVLRLRKSIADCAIVIKQLAVAFNEDVVNLLETEKWISLDYHSRCEEKEESK